MNWENDIGREIREEIRDSKSGLSKIIALETAPILQGAVLGLAGRTTGADWIPAVPLVMDLMGGVQKISTYAKYGIGVALAYSDRIYLMASGLF